MRLLFLYLLLICQLANSSPTDSVKTPPVQPKGTLVSSFAGHVAGQSLSTRDILLNSLIEDILYRETKSRLKVSDYKSKNFAREADAVLLEKAISIEAQGFPVAEVSESELTGKLRTFRSRIKKGLYGKIFRSIQPSEKELKVALRSKIASKKLLKFKLDSAVVPVSDEEARDYFENNRFKFEKLPFENFRENIKNFLSRRQVDQRIKEWFGVLKTKYRIENYLTRDKSGKVSS